MAPPDDHQLATSGTELTPVQRQVEENRANGWQDLDARDRGVAIAFVGCHYSYKETADELETTPGQIRKIIHSPIVAAFVQELQQDDYVQYMVSRQFITSQLLSMIPKLAGEEDVPMVVDGVQLYRRKFFPGELRAVLETLASSTDFKKEADGSKGGVNVQINFGHMLSEEQPEINVTPAGGEDNG